MSDGRKVVRGVARTLLDPGPGRSRVRVLQGPDAAPARQLLRGGAHCASARSPSGSPSGCSTPGVSRRYHSASSADWVPEPAAVTAWRYVWSTRSPAANTPGLLVRVERPWVMT